MCRVGETGPRRICGNQMCCHYRGRFCRIPQLPEGVIFQEDGAPPHYGNIVREFLDTTFPQRWIGRGAVMAWPPRSPDITPLDFYLWGYVKQRVYSERINDIDHLKQRITDVIHSVTPDVLTRMWEELDYRLDVCRQQMEPI
ncbi:hypothetical protein AVEN_97123-1 [Araneus ventricosus]|uniref:Tc1-like transposase DDE domain-containing protein n=1 Tax=Araneus ventricosus TaxID=182803 RepID=A0A4Y2QR78_ARAVE|nr:hypothetical protein AVEN_97123-1 [Araneus ventricosus]